MLGTCPHSPSTSERPSRQGRTLARRFGDPRFLEPVRVTARTSARQEMVDVAGGRHARSASLTQGGPDDHVQSGRRGHDHRDRGHRRIGSVIAGRLAAGGERLRLASADQKSARILASRIGPTAEVAVDDRQAVIGARAAVVLALRFPVLKGVIAEIADSLDDRVVVVPSNPFGVDPQGAIYRLLPKEQASGDVIAGVAAVGGASGHGLRQPLSGTVRGVGQPLADESRLVLCNRRRAGDRRGRTVDPNCRIRGRQDRWARAVEPAGGRWRSSRSRARRARCPVVAPRFDRRRSTSDS